MARWRIRMDSAKCKQSVDEPADTFQLMTLYRIPPDIGHPSTKEPPGLLRSDCKSSDGETMISWSPANSTPGTPPVSIYASSCTLIRYRRCLRIDVTGLKYPHPHVKHG